MRTTHELDPAEGTVFVTDVPGDFQVLGRRGPTGELFSGSLIIRGPDAGDHHVSLAESNNVEVVRGPEAKRLVEDTVALHRRSGTLPN